MVTITELNYKMGLDEIFAAIHLVKMETMNFITLWRRWKKNAMRQSERRNKINNKNGKLSIIIFGEWF